MSRSARQSKLVVLYEKMSKLTADRCGAPCGETKPYRCCERRFCDMATEWAKKAWGVTLKPSGHESIPYMGEHGCVVPPHMRPVCTLHNCRVASGGHDPEDAAWSARYASIRGKIEAREPHLRIVNPGSDSTGAAP